MTEDKYDLLVIGGGPAGMMAAGVAAGKGKKVLLIEKNLELGKKLKLTGGGRCNITNAVFDDRKFLAKFGPAEKFLYSPFSQFGVQDTFDFFEKLNLPLVIEARQRVFPKSQKATDVVKALINYLEKGRVVIIKDNPVKKIEFDSESKKIISVVTKKGKYSAKNYIIATGGKSHPETGSTGEGFSWLEKMGHTIKKSTPGVVPLEIEDKWVKDLAGVSLSFMKITFYLNGKKVFSETGKILFTHFGISGPLILNLAKRVGELLEKGKVTATIDCYPDTDLGSLDKNIIKVFDENKNKSFKNIVDDITPHGLANALIEFHIIPNVDDKVHGISKENRKKIVQLLKAMPMTIIDLMGMDKAVVSDGGVSLFEVDTKTMRSKLVNNLYIIGDALDINRLSGGFSLQLCWTTGYVAGQLN